MVCIYNKFNYLSFNYTPDFSFNLQISFEKKVKYKSFVTVNRAG
ncbi:hypothetical protein J2X61_002791 [Bacillus sp. 3255]|nr:hypothetical protein [Bacillus sp. 3255]